MTDTSPVRARRRAVFKRSERNVYFIGLIANIAKKINVWRELHFAVISLSPPRSLFLSQSALFGFWLFLAVFRAALSIDLVDG